MTVERTHNCHYVKSDGHGWPAVAGVLLRRGALEFRIRRVTVESIIQWGIGVEPLGRTAYGVMGGKRQRGGWSGDGSDRDEEQLRDHFPGERRDQASERIIPRGL